MTPQPFATKKQVQRKTDSIQHQLDQLKHNHGKKHLHHDARDETMEGTLDHESHRINGIEASLMKHFGYKPKFSPRFPRESYDGPFQMPLQPARVVTVRSAAPAQASPPVQEPSQSIEEEDYDGPIIALCAILLLIAVVLIIVFVGPRPLI